MIPIVNCELFIVNLKRKVSFFGFPCELEGETLVTRHTHGLLAFADGDIERIEANDGLPFLVDLEHELVCFAFGFEEDRLKHFDHELHGGEVVVVHYDAIHAGIVVRETRALFDI